MWWSEEFSDTLLDSVRACPEQSRRGDHQLYESGTIAPQEVKLWQSESVYSQPAGMRQA
jgi:hypothetical protein